MQGRTRPIVDHVSAWRRSGLTVGAYCRQAGISENTYYYWRTRLLQRGALVPSLVQQKAATVPFLEVGSRLASANGYALRFHRAGVDLLVCRGFDAGEVTALARVASSLEGGGAGC